MCYSLWYKAPTKLPAGGVEVEFLYVNDERSSKHNLYRFFKFLFFLQLLLVYVLQLSRFTSDLINMFYYFVYNFLKIS